ncbi:zinc metalloproteinase nas-7 isoform X1 [Nilaparvata lugens]|uniref:zinc metalloproteinase nas-7 isoform X1 n=2 Tax=Nilaparvata lugens TaxID=108931 RepID=UPI00193E8ADC|nr:zinc metalloproteinase nas-7 isoform X1 [Nilaparvata lugens]
MKLTWTIFLEAPSSIRHLSSLLLLATLFLSAYSLPVKEDYKNIQNGTGKNLILGGKHYPIPPGTDKSLYGKYFEGDIFMEKAPKPGGKNAVSDPDLLWPYGAVVFKVDDNVGCPESPQCEILAKALNHYHAKSCIRFKEWTGEENYVHIFFNTENSGACWSPVGRIGSGEQRLSLGQRCWYFGIIVHELGHSIGFWHEMNRPDRDSWIYVFWSNIIPGYETAFAVHDDNSVDMLGERFDYKSIMMYDEYAFSKDGISPTLQARNYEEIGPIWKKRGLSGSDIKRLQKLYKCRGNRPLTGFPYDITCSFNKDTCGFKNGLTAAWNWRTVNSTDGYVYTSYESAGGALGQFTSVNFHPISSKDKTRGPLGCVRFWYLLQGDGKASIKLQHSYLQKVTQLNPDPDTTFDLWENDTVTGDWIHVEVPFYITRPFKLIFQSQFESEASYGTIALDDVEILYSQCTNDTIITASISSLGSNTQQSVTDHPITSKYQAPPPPPPTPDSKPETSTLQDESNEMLFDEGIESDENGEDYLTNKVKV